MDGINYEMLFSIRFLTTHFSSMISLNRWIFCFTRTFLHQRKSLKRFSKGARVQTVIWLIFIDNFKYNQRFVHCYVMNINDNRRSTVNNFFKVLKYYFIVIAIP